MTWWMAVEDRCQSLVTMAGTPLSGHGGNGPDRKGTVGQLGPNLPYPARRAMG